MSLQRGPKMTLRSTRLCAVALLASGAIGCSPASDDAPKGASHFQINGGGCNVGVSQGYTIPVGSQPTTVTSQGARVEDGKEGADVSCKVSEDGDGYFLSGTVQQRTRSFTVSGTVDPTADGGYSGFGTVIQADSPTSLNLRSPANSCNITVMEGQQIKKGYVWGNFDCPSVVHEPNQNCPAIGSFVFEHCDD